MFFQFDKQIYSITSVPDHLNKRTTSRLGPLLSSFKVFPIDVMIKDYPLVDHPRYSGLGPLFLHKTSLETR